MNKRTMGLLGVGGVAVTAMCLGGTVAANAASTSDNAGIASVTSSATAKTYTVTATRLTAGEDAVVKLTSTTSEAVTRTYTTVNDSGRVVYTFSPTKAGVYTVKFYADGETTTKKITVGTAYTAATVSADDTSDKTTTISGTGVAGARLQVKVYDENGDLASLKTVTVDSSGEWSTTFAKATDDGEYTVTARYVATANRYSKKSYSTTFERD